MISFLNLIKQECKDFYFVFTNFSCSQLITINQLYIVLLQYTNLQLFILYQLTSQTNHHSEELEFPDNHQDC